MDHVSNLIERVEEYADAVGVTPSTVFRKATGNPRLWERFKRRADSLESDIARVEQYILDNPASVACAERHANRHTPLNNEIQGGDL